MNKTLIFSLLCIGFLGIANSVFAGVVTLPNPLCPNMVNPCVSTPTCICNFTDLITRITKFILTVIGALAVIIFVWAGILFLTSGGNEGQLSKARKALTYAIIGLAIALGGSGLIVLIRTIIGAPP